MTFLQRIQAFDRLRDKLEIILSTYPSFDEKNFFNHPFYDAIQQQCIQNKWFTPFFIKRALEAIVEMLNISDLQLFKDQYAPFLNNPTSQKKVVFVISAGNIPLAAFHDFFSVLVSGNTFLGKLSANDNLLLPEMAKLLVEVEPSFESRIFFKDPFDRVQTEKLVYHKVISTGSNNSARYFDYYFGKFPNILRKNRNSIAILTGNESENELELLCDDIFLYFGLGCRSVSKIYIPKNYNFVPLIESMIKNSVYLCNHHHYLNNIEYQKTMHLMNQIPFYDATVQLLVENCSLNSPLSVLHYEYYDDISTVFSHIKSVQDQIQCVAIQQEYIRNPLLTGLETITTSLGNTQHPSLFEFPDQIDTVKFCLS
ncbi:MAG TPA: hypothetical protein PLI77_07055 [Bacteroidales bacterium]|nr:hypothetical protein [Bacteroidales bacterium]